MQQGATLPRRRLGAQAGGQPLPQLLGPLPTLQGCELQGLTCIGLGADNALFALLALDSISA